MKTRREARLRILAADLAELEGREAQRRIKDVIAEATSSNLPPGPGLKPYQLDSAFRAH
jgi:hypothetical protein